MPVSKVPSRQVQKTLRIFIPYDTHRIYFASRHPYSHATGVHMAKYHHTNKNINFTIFAFETIPVSVLQACSTSNEMKSFKTVSLASYGISHRSAQ